MSYSVSTMLVYYYGTKIVISDEQILDSGTGGKFANTLTTNSICFFLKKNIDIVRSES